MQARYDLAVEAIKTFHTGVSEDFLLKQDQFKDLRDRLLKSASDFYGKLGALLEERVRLRLAAGTAAGQLRGRQPDRNGRPQGRRPRDPSRGAGGAGVNGPRAAGRSRADSRRRPQPHGRRCDTATGRQVGRSAGDLSQGDHRPG